MNITTNRIKWIDTAKGIGLLCVILGHLHLPYISTWIYTFHIPLFFFLSGCVFAGNKYSFKEYFIRKFKSLVIPYFVLGVVILLFNYICFFFQKTPICMYIETTFNFFKQEHFWTVWFLAALFLVEIIYYIIYKLCKQKLVLVSIASLSLCVVGLLRYRFGFGSLPWNFDVALIAQSFFCLGHIFNTTKIKNLFLNKNIFKALIIFIVFFAINVFCGFLCIKVSGQSLDMSIGMYGNEILTFISAIAGILAIIVFSNKISIKAIMWLGQNTMIIFAWHSRIIIVLCDIIFNRLGFFESKSVISSFERGLLIFIIILFVLVPITLLVKRTKIHKLFGV